MTQRSDAGEARTRGPRSRVYHYTTEPLRSHWTFYSSYLTHYRDNPAIGPIHVVRKLFLFCYNGL